MSTPERQNKRRSLLRWQENRLRRIDAKLKINTADADNLLFHAVFNDVSPESFERCRERGHQLACDIQIEWGHCNATKLRASA